MILHLNVSQNGGRENNAARNAFYHRFSYSNVFYSVSADFLKVLTINTEPGLCLQGASRLTEPDIARLLSRSIFQFRISSTSQWTIF